MSANASRPADSQESSDLAWRVIGLLNINRLMVPMVLILLIILVQRGLPAILLDTGML